MREMVNKNWSLDEAFAENQKVLASDPSRSDADPTLPFYQWAALHQLDDCERRYREDSYWLMTAIRICANHNLPLPEWASRAYIKAYDMVNNYRAKSWNAVFGNPFPKGQHLSAARKRREKGVAVWLEIRRIQQMHPDRPIDESLFEEVGKQFNIGKTLASEYYYAVKMQMGF